MYTAMCHTYIPFFPDYTSIGGKERAIEYDVHSVTKTIAPRIINYYCT